MGNVFGGIGHSYSRPFHWNGNDWANFGYLSAGTLALFFVDDEFDHWVGGFEDDVPDLLVDYGNEYGSPENNYMITGGVYLVGLFTKNEKLRRTGVLLISSATAGGFLQQVSKRIIGRARPRSGDSSNVYDPFHIDRVRNYDSFPSGHAMLAFTNAYAIAKQFKNPWVKAGIYTVGLVPGFARIVDGYHWISDVAFSTVLSIFIVESIDKYLDSKYNEKYNNQAKAVSWNLSFGPGTMGVALRF
ncbi:phosphatase PAP2 family protein [Flagellimonas flava]|nr:phosphatase PAP2 family protein [Allomuricauda flava]